MFNLSKILSRLGDTETPFDEGTGNFQRVNVENAKRNLDLKNRAKENGESGIPLADSKNKDSMAVEIDTYITEIITLAKDKLVDRLHAIDGLSNSQLVDVRKEISAIYENGRNELWISAKDFYNELFNLRREWITGEKEYVEFRENHNRVGPARYPERAAVINAVGIIALCFFIEIAMNAYALGTSHPDGPKGVILEIFLFGAINLGTAFFLGRYVWGYFKHVKYIWRSFAFILSAIMLSFIVVLNGFIGHYRDALAKLASKVSGASLTSLLQEQLQLASTGVASLLDNPLILGDFKAYMIVGFGLIAAIVAMIKSYGLDEPYPGYGKISREQARLAESFNDIQTAHLREINDLTDDFVDQLNGQIALLEGNSAAIRYRSDDQKRLLDKYQNWLVSAESAGKALYAYYREENMKFREDKKEPYSFSNHHFELPEITKNIPEITETAEFDAETVKNETANMASTLNADLRYYQDRFKDLTNLSPDQAIQEGFSDSDFKRPD